MRHILFLLILFANASLTADPASWFVTEEGKPQDALIELLVLDNLYDPNDDLSTIVEKTQKKWLQVQQGKDNKELTDLQDSPEQQSMRLKTEQAVERLGLFAEQTPSRMHYDYGICLGAFLDGVRHRLEGLIDQWEKGVRFDSLIFLSGERPLRKEKEDSLEKLGWKLDGDTAYETEYDMCKVVWEQSDVPEDMRHALDGKVIFVNAPCPEGKGRPATKDLYRTWLNEYSPESGTILAISHPMLWCYQHLAARNVLPDTYLLDTCAKAATAEIRERYQQRLVSIMRDSIAKCLFEVNARKKVLTNDKKLSTVTKK